MTTNERYVVSVHGVAVGILRKQGLAVVFQVLDSYLNTYPRPTLGQVFDENPRATWSEREKAPNWFRNLLPEKDGPLRRFLARAADVPENDDVGLLVALGRDLPGAVGIGPEAEWGEIDEAREWPSRDPRDVRKAPLGGLRFSVAGIQMKLSLVNEMNTLRLASRGEYGNSYAKVPTGRPDLPANEYTIMTLGAACKLHVPQVQLITLEKLSDDIPEFLQHRALSEVFLIERFDRLEQTVRHIEDFNQVVDNDVDRKYQGASVETLGKLVLNICGEEDFWEYYRRMVFFISIGNEDAHLKNWSLVYDIDGAHPRLSPMYDAVSTIQYPELTREFALRLGNHRRCEYYTSEVMRRLARKAGAGEDRAAEELGRMVTLIQDVESQLRASLPVEDDFWRRIDAHRNNVPFFHDFLH